MANAVYPIWKVAIASGTAANDLDVDTTANGVYCVLIDTGTYTYNIAHDTYSDLSGVVGGTGQRITTPTITAVAAGATFDGDNLTYTAVTGASVEALVIYRAAGTGAGDAAGPLVLYEDTSVTGLPVTPNGGNITVTWNASGIFTL